MNPALIAGGIQAIGGILGGASRNKAAKKQTQRVERYSDDAIQAARDDEGRARMYAIQDQERMGQFTASEQARRNGALGFDLQKLRDESVAAGFNPLTVMANGGLSGYDKGSAFVPGQFISTPFISTADQYAAKADRIAGVGQSQVETAGYFGDALASGASAYFMQMNEQTKNAIDMARTAAMEPLVRNNGTVASPFGASVAREDLRPTRVAAGTPFSPAPSLTSPVWVDNGNGTTFVPFLNGGGSSFTNEYISAKGWTRDRPVDGEELGDDWSSILNAVGSFDTWFSGTEFMRNLQSHEKRINQSAPASTWGVPPRVTRRFDPNHRDGYYSSW